MGLTSTQVSDAQQTIKDLQQKGIPFDVNIDEDTIKTMAKYILLAIAGGVALGGFFLALFQRLLRSFKNE